MYIITILLTQTSCVVCLTCFVFLFLLFLSPLNSVHNNSLSGQTNLKKRSGISRKILVFWIFFFVARKLSRAWKFMKISYSQFHFVRWISVSFDVISRHLANSVCMFIAQRVSVLAINALTYLDYLSGWIRNLIFISSCEFMHFVNTCRNVWLWRFKNVIAT